MLSSQSVSELNRQIGALLESTFLHVKVEGEVSRPTYHTSGHLYFTLKDKEASISCVMFKGNASKLKFKIEDGISLVVDGSINVYAPRGTYQINVVAANPSGTGALALAYEQLKERLFKKGYFDKKRVLLKLPLHISVVTSRTGAALQDMLNVANKRWPLAKITLINSTVQGESAKFEIAKAIKIADSLNSDIMIVGRGGGSIEDLWAFNEEEVADAIYNAKTPVISAVGHEIDFVISDFVADVRAPTPSAAMEIALPDQNEYKQMIDYRLENFNEFFKKILAKKIEQLKNLNELYKQNSYETKLEFQKSNLTNLTNSFNLKFAQILEYKNSDIKRVKDTLNMSFERVISQKESLFSSLNNIFLLKEPTKQSKEGYAQVVKNGKKIALESIKKDEEFELQSAGVKVISKALKIEKI